MGDAVHTDNRGGLYVGQSIYSALNFLRKAKRPHRKASGAGKPERFVFETNMKNRATPDRAKKPEKLFEKEKAELKAEIEKEVKGDKPIDLETLLLSGPTATKKQLDTIAKNRKAINQWRTK